MQSKSSNTYSISVVIPTYNRSAQLMEAIRSVLSQTYSVTEILVCDDGSSDDSEQQVKLLNSPLIKWIACGRNGRPAIPRNTGIRQAIGNYIAFLDSDDIWFPTKLEEQIAVLKNNYNAVCSNALIKKNNVITGNYQDRKNLSIDFKKLVANNYVVCSSMVAEKELLLNCGLFPEEKELKALEDYTLWLRLSLNTNIYYLSKPLIVYTDEAITSIRSDSLTTQEQQAIIFKNFKRWCKNTTRVRKKEYISYMETWFILKYKNRRQRLAYLLKKNLGLLHD